MTDPQYSPPPATPYAPAGGPQPTKSPVLSILSLVGGIVSILLAFFFGTGLIFGIAGIILGHLGQRRERPARGLWLTGLILSYIGTALSLLILLFTIIGLVALANYSSSTVGG
jgi:hypothetical protein